MPEPSQFESILSVLKTVAPWLTGGLAGASLTLIAKLRSDRKKRKALLVSTEVRRFSLEKDGKNEFVADGGLKVSYKGREYDHLLLYSILIKNTGYGSITNQGVVFLASSDTEIIEHKIEMKPLAIPYSTNQIVTENGQEYHFEFSKLANLDNINISYLVNSKSSEPIRIFPRGSDEVEYVNEDMVAQDLAETDLRKLFTFFALYIVFDAIQFFAGAFQACVVLLAIPTAMNVIKSILNKKNQPSININGINLEGENRVSIELISR